MVNEEENIPFSSRTKDFGLPEGYFQKSAETILNKLDWLEEHKAYPHLSALPRQSGFRVPERYFDRLELRLELLSTPRLFSLQKQQVFVVPDAYFEDAELRELAKMISGGDETALDFIPRQNPFTVEPTYFSESRKKLKEMLGMHEQAPQMIRLFRSRAWMAAAAMLLLVIGAWLYSLYFNPGLSGDCGTVACIDRQEILKSKALENLESDELYDLVNSKKLEEKLEHQPAKTPNIHNRDSNHKHKNVPDELLDEI